MGINPRVRDRDPKFTLRRILIVITALGDIAPRKVIDWILTSIDGSDGDIRKVVAFAHAASDARADDDTRVLPHEAVAVIRDVCVRRLSA